MIADTGMQLTTAGWSTWTDIIANLCYNKHMTVNTETTNFISFGKKQYHRNIDMVDWCGKHIGPGGWSWGFPDPWEDMEDRIWCVFGVFGNITFCFKDPKHLTLFILKWGEG